MTPHRVFSLVFCMILLAGASSAQGRERCDPVVLQDRTAQSWGWMVGDAAASAINAAESKPRRTRSMC